MTSAEQLEILAMTHALIDAGWTQFAYERDKRYCLLGAAEAAAWDLGEADQEFRATKRWEETMQLLVRAMGKPADPQDQSYRWLLLNWNDASPRRKRDVLRLIERAAAKVGKG